MSKAKRYVLVTTEHRGVFAGYLNGDQTGDESVVTLTDARNCIHWSADVKGFLGLAATGPSASCKVGPKAPKLTLQKVTSVADCTPEAVRAWESAPWR